MLQDDTLENKFGLFDKTLLEQKVVLKLFKGYIYSETDNKDITIEDGILSNGILFIGPINKDINLKNIAKDLYKVDVESWNQTFHKSFSTVENTDYETLVIEQLVHYITTYGFKELNIYDKDTVYIPKEKLEIPELKDDVKLTIIKPLTEKEVQDKVMDLLCSGIALSKETMNDILVLNNYIDKDRIDNIKNIEFKTILYDKYNIVPKDNIMFLRYLIYKTTGETLLIKDKELIEKIKNADVSKAIELLNKYDKQVRCPGTNSNRGFNELAVIFYRYKPLFLAFKRTNRSLKKNREINAIINKLRKIATYTHRDNDQKEVDKLYSRYIDIDKLKEELKKVTTFRLFRMLNGVNHRKIACSLNAKDYPELYKIRNGKIYVKVAQSKAVNKFSTTDEDKLDEVQKAIDNEIKNRLLNKDKILNKTFYIPEYIDYTLPTSEKQFIDNIPSNTSIRIPKKDGNLFVAVHWNNLDDNEQVDLDLHAQNKGCSIGWNASYRTKGLDVLFSGDVTDAPLPNGATEVILVKSIKKGAQLMLTLNRYTDNKSNVPFQLLIGYLDDDEISRNYMINPNNILFKANMKFTDKNNINLGVLKVKDNQCIFIFDNGNINNSIIQTDKNLAELYIKATDLVNKSQITLKDLIIECGGILKDKPVYYELEQVGIDDKGNPVYDKKEVKVDYDLSLETIDKSTLIDLLVK